MSRRRRISQHGNTPVRKGGRTLTFDECVKALWPSSPWGTWWKRPDHEPGPGEGNVCIYCKRRRWWLDLDRTKCNAHNRPKNKLDRNDNVIKRRQRRHRKTREGLHCKDVRDCRHARKKLKPESTLSETDLYPPGWFDHENED